MLVCNSVTLGIPSKNIGNSARLTVFTRICTVPDLNKKVARISIAIWDAFRIVLNTARLELRA